MNLNQKIILFILYLLGMLLFFMGSFGSPFNLRYIFIGTGMLAIPWIACMISAWKEVKDGGLWFYFILFFGSVAIPLYLFSRKTQETKVN